MPPPRRRRSHARQQFVRVAVHSRADHRFARLARRVLVRVVAFEIIRIDDAIDAVFFRVIARRGDDASRARRRRPERRARASSAERFERDRRSPRRADAREPARGRRRARARDARDRARDGRASRGRDAAAAAHGLGRARASERDGASDGRARERAQAIDAYGSRARRDLEDGREVSNGDAVRSGGIERTRRASYF